MGKSPFEIRSDLLRLAYQICFDRYEREKTPLPTTEDIIEEAAKLNKFVSENKN